MTLGKLALAIGAAIGILVVLGGKDDIRRYIKMRQM
jgi:hypothetical protein